MSEEFNLEELFDEDAERELDPNRDLQWGNVTEENYEDMTTDGGCNDYD
jgi:hypothetical protein